MDRRILVVDADHHRRNAVRAILAGAGYEPSVVDSGVDAMRIMLAEAPPAVLCRLTGPRFDGLGLCQDLRSHEGVGFVYFMMSLTAEETRHTATALQHGADAVIPTEIDAERLLAHMVAGDRVVALHRELTRQNRQVFKYNAKLAIVNDRLHQAATTDELTGAVNRRAGMNRLTECWSVASRNGDSLAVMILDVDHFKVINDTYGHDVGDLVLKEVADALRRSCRLGEVVCRFGGEEFMVICSASDASMAAVAARRLRATVEGITSQVRGFPVKVTASIGVAERTASMPDPDALLRAADRALYAAKHGGRNRVVIAGEEWSGGENQVSTLRLPTDLARIPAPGELARNARTVLVADGDESARAWYVQLLQQGGFNVIESPNGADALGCIQHAQPDIVIFSRDLPVLDGVECTRRLKRDPDFWHLPVLLASQRRDDERDAVAAWDAGADGLTMQGIRPHEFLAQIRSMLSLRRGRKELIQANENLGEQARTMTLLLELAQSISTASSLPAVLERVVHVTAELTCCTCVAVLLPDETGETLQVAHAAGFANEKISYLRIPTAGALFGDISAQRESLVINDTNDERLGHGIDPDLFGARPPLVIVPLMTGERSVGALLAAERLGGQPFVTRDLEYIHLIGNIAASTIEEISARQACDEARDSIVVALAKLAEHRDGSTGHHLDRVTRFAVLLAQELRASGPYKDSIDGPFIADLERAVPLHDIGKVGIPDRILLKSGKLTDEEMAIMKTHTKIGTETIQSVAQRVPGAHFLKMAADIAWGHHEKFDGSGYPSGTSGTDIPLAARITSVADVYDALTTRRPYKEGLSHDQAIHIIRETSGSHFDSVIVDAFVVKEHEFALLAAQLADDDASMDSRRRADYVKRATQDIHLDPLAGELASIQHQIHQLADLCKQASVADITEGRG